MSHSECMFNISAFISCTELQLCKGATGTLTAHCVDERDTKKIDVGLSVNDAKMNLRTNHGAERAHTVIRAV